MLLQCFCCLCGDSNPTGKGFASLGGLLNSNENIGIKCKPNVESLWSCFSSTDHLVVDKSGSHSQNMYTYVLFDPDVTHTWVW
jgi:hypothetical protein